MKIQFVTLILLTGTLLSVVGCSSCGSSSERPSTPAPQPTDLASSADDDPVPASSPDVSILAKATNAFAIDLYGLLREREGNLAFSPSSIEVALAMTWAGARSETKTEMTKVLHLAGDDTSVHGAAKSLLADWNNPSRDAYELRVVNRLFGESSYEFEQTFLDLTREQYGAELERLSFRSDQEGSRAKINGWVEGQTKNRIQKLLPSGSITDMTRLVLTNAVYFLGRWSTRFEESATAEQVFHTFDGREVQVQMMHQTQTFGYARHDGLQVLEMRYVGDDLAMTIILPDANDGLLAIEERLSVEEIDRWVGSLHQQKVRVAFPRARIYPQDSIQLKGELSKLGMPLAFSRSADFSGMSNPTDPNESLMIDNVYHKAFVNIDEAGTEAAAATAVVMKARGAAHTPNVPEFRADHPFLFLIRDLRTGTILFIGRVHDASERGA